jgi:pimeloyl-ACP methyl ester carboxylesterase
VLFVHGAHHSGWCWLLVMDQLTAWGVPSCAIDLPLTGYTDDVACVRSAVASLNSRGAVHLVGHSYSGLVVAAAGHAAAHLTFVAGRLPLPAESPTAHTPEWGFPEFQACMEVGGDGVVRLTGAARAFLYHRTSPSLADFAMSHLRPMSSAVPDEPLADPAWVSVPSSYVVCGDDRAVRPEAQRQRAALVATSTELDTDHSPFFSSPRSLATFIADQPAGMAA